MARSKSSIANALYLNMVMNVAGICLLLQGRPEMVLRNSGGNLDKMAGMLSLMSSGVGVLEFLLNPTAGRLSDRYGRKPFLLASPVINAVLKMTVVFS
jgi:MFS family permease